MQNDKITVFQENCQKISDELQKVIVGHTFAIDVLMAAFFSGGHVLIEGVPGLGKTLLASSFAQVSGLEFKKIQFTPDLMPADITGTHIIVEKEGKRSFEFQKGPFFAHIVLADEINRATPKTQSALLEGMQERCVTAGTETILLPCPFMVIGTQNPIEMKGTYPLPEAQKDRFMFKINIDTSTSEELEEILKRTTSSTMPSVSPIVSRDKIEDMIQTVKDIVVPKHVREMTAHIIMLSNPLSQESPPLIKKYVRYGSSVRGGQALIAGAKIDALLQGQVNTTEDGIKKYIYPALRHRIILNFEAGADEITPNAVLQELIDSLS